MNEQEWENVIEASSFCWLAWASLCQPLWEAQISIRSASLCAWQRVYRGSFLNQASPTAGTAPDKGPLWRGFLSPRTSAGKRLRWTNECFCGRDEQGTAVKETDRERGNKQRGRVGGGGHANAHTYTHSQSQTARHKIDGGACGDLFGICSMHPIDICATNLLFLQRRSGTHTLGAGMWLRAAALLWYRFGI